MPPNATVIQNYIENVSLFISALNIINYGISGLELTVEIYNMPYVELSLKLQLG